MQRRAVRVKDASARPKTGSMAGGRPLGSKDAHPRSRRKETQGQKIAKKKRKAAANKVAKIAGRNRMAEALGGGAALQGQGPVQGKTQPRVGRGNGHHRGRSRGRKGSSSRWWCCGSCFFGSGCSTGCSSRCILSIRSAQDISASLDDDDHRIPQDSVMGQCPTVFMRLSKVSTKFVGLEENKWLLDMLKDDDWWLRANFAHRVCASCM